MWKRRRRLGAARKPKKEDARLVRRKGDARLVRRKSLEFEVFLDCVMLPGRYKC